MTTGKKFDQEKARWDLVPHRAMASVVAVLTYGARKYAPNNWALVEDARSRYYAACQRHLNAWVVGEATDPETGLSHVSHAICCLLFLAAFEAGDADAHTRVNMPTEAFR